MHATVEQPVPLYPVLLQKEDTIGLVAPAGSWDEDEFKRGIEILQQFGFRVKIAQGIEKKEKYLAGSDQHRTAIFHNIWRDPEVKAVLAVRGGYGSLRILSSLDYNLIRFHPKIFIGFSDITALHCAIHGHTGLITFHGPVLTSLAKHDDTSVHSFFDTLTSGLCRPICERSIEILRSGNASGEIVGGNLTTAVHLLGTPFEISWKDKLVFLEDIGEAPYRIDRMLSHLSMAGRLSDIRGLILGSFTNCGEKEFIWERVLQLLESEHVPVWANFPIGHGKENRIVPFGAFAEMDSSTATLNFPSPCCRFP